MVHVVSAYACSDILRPSDDTSHERCGPVCTLTVPSLDNFRYNTPRQSKRAPDVAKHHSKRSIIHLNIKPSAKSNREQQGSGHSYIIQGKYRLRDDKSEKKRTGTVHTGTPHHGIDQCHQRVFFLLSDSSCRWGTLFTHTSSMEKYRLWDEKFEKNIRGHLIIASKNVIKEFFSPSQILPVGGGRGGRPHGSESRHPQQPRHRENHCQVNHMISQKLVIKKERIIVR